MYEPVFFVRTILSYKVHDTLFGNMCIASSTLHMVTTSFRPENTTRREYYIPT